MCLLYLQYVKIADKFCPDLITPSILEHTMKLFYHNQSVSHSIQLLTLDLLNISKNQNYNNQFYSYLICNIIEHSSSNNKDIISECILILKKIKNMNRIRDILYDISLRYKDNYKTFGNYYFIYCFLFFILFFLCFFPKKWKRIKDNKFQIRPNHQN